MDKEPQTFEEAVDSVLAEMRKVMQAKQADYGPSNVSQAGEYGVALRANDKVQRVMNLLSQEKEQIKSVREIVVGYQKSSQSPDDASHALVSLQEVLGDGPKNESLRDSFIDLANYGLILVLLHDGIWGLPMEDGRA